MNSEITVIKVALADDHVLLRKALASLINGFGDCEVMQEASNGWELLEKIKKTEPPDVAILDLNMPELDGFQTAERLLKYYPQVHVLMLTMYDSELSLIRLLHAGVKGFLKKDIHPSELKFAIQSVIQSGFYYSNHTTGKLVNLFRGDNSNGGVTNLQRSMLSDQEVDFLRLTCSELTYKGIAQAMGLNPRSIDTLRDQLFNKLDVRTRVGLAMVAMRHGIVTF